MSSDLAARARKRAEELQNKGPDWKPSVDTRFEIVAELRELADENEQLRRFKEGFINAMPPLVLLQDWFPTQEVRDDVQRILAEVCSHSDEVRGLREALTKLSATMAQVHKGGAAWAI